MNLRKGTKFKRTDANRIAQSFKFYTPNAPSPRALFQPTTPNSPVERLPRVDEHLLRPSDYRNILPDSQQSSHNLDTTGIVNDVSLLSGVDKATASKVITAYGQAISARVCSGGSAYIPYIGTVAAKTIFQKELSNPQDRPGIVTISFVKRLWPILTPATNLVKELVLRFGIRHVPQWDEHLEIKRKNKLTTKKNSEQTMNKLVDKLIKQIQSSFNGGKNR